VGFGYQITESPPNPAQLKEIPTASVSTTKAIASRILKNTWHNQNNFNAPQQLIYDVLDVCAKFVDVLPPVDTRRRK